MSKNIPRGVIYKYVIVIECKYNGEIYVIGTIVYVGQSKNGIPRNFSVSELSHEGVAKKEAFKVLKPYVKAVVIEDVEDITKLDEREAFWIDAIKNEYQLVKDDNGNYKRDVMGNYIKKPVHKLISDTKNVSYKKPNLLKYCPEEFKPAAALAIQEIDNDVYPDKVTIINNFRNYKKLDPIFTSKKQIYFLQNINDETEKIWFESKKQIGDFFHEKYNSVTANTHIDKFNKALKNNYPYKDYKCEIQSKYDINF